MSNLDNNNDRIFLFAQGQSYCNHINEHDKKFLLGNKGANLVEMCKLNVQVPPGFILSTNICRNNDLHEDELYDILNKLEGISQRQFGNKYNPLLLSIRSGAAISMPGMMDTILNIGLNDEIVDYLATINANFAYDSYKRLLQMYGSIVLNIDEELFRNISLQYHDLQLIIKEFKLLIYNKTGAEFPQDVKVQLIQSIYAVFNSWNSERAIIYRNKNHISHHLSTAVIVQTMVFGNLDDNSCTGVVFSRNPIDGTNQIFGEFLPKAQGEDVVSGFLNTYSIAEKNNGQISMESAYYNTFQELKDIALTLENYFGDVQDIEFTVEKGQLWILQTRNAKRSAIAAMKIAIDMVNEGVKNKIEALKIIPLSAIEQNLHKQLIIEPDSQVIAYGLPASPGAASGIIALTPYHAEILSKNHNVILVRNETNPEDIAGMYCSDGILTAKGGMTSHAAVVARGMGKPCICGASSISILDNRTISINGIIFKEGDFITINGNTGEIFNGKMDMTVAKTSVEFTTIMLWADEYKKIDVFANAETIEDLKTSIMFGASGIGLCRTEHMFFNKDRINDVRKMILASSVHEREAILIRLGAFQKNDFKNLFNILNDKSICIRLLDPPLHEFLPHTNQDIEDYCIYNNEDYNNVLNAIRSKVECNPMLGHRGVRLGITYNEIYKCQIKAIFQAAQEYYTLTQKNANIEIMVPLAFSEKELLMVKNMINSISIEFAHNIKYRFGAMIELPRMALIADKIAPHVDFVSFGTNDLTQTTFGISRDDSHKFLSRYVELDIVDNDPFVSIDKNGVGELMKIAINKIKAINAKVKIGVCGEHGGDAESIKFFNELGCDYISCSPYRIPLAKLAASIT